MHLIPKAQYITALVFFCAQAVAEEGRLQTGFLYPHLLMVQLASFGSSKPYRPTSSFQQRAGSFSRENSFQQRASSYSRESSFQHRETPYHGTEDAYSTASPANSAFDS